MSKSTISNMSKDSQSMAQIASLAACAVGFSVSLMTILDWNLAPT